MTAAGRIRTAALTAAVVAGLIATATTASAQDRDCAEFADRESAQAAFEAAGPGDPLRLDEDGNGLACESLPPRAVAQRSGAGATSSTRAASTSPTSSSTAATATSTTPPTTVGEGLYQVGRDLAAGLYRTPGGTRACSWFRLSDNTGSSRSVIASGSGQGPSSVTVLASDPFVQFAGDCRWTRDATVPTSSSATPTSSSTAPTTTSAAPTSVRPNDRDCDDFPTQAQAQAALAADRTDPDALDTDGDGIACEELFGTQGRQVAVVPNGGVATGGRSAP